MRWRLKEAAVDLSFHSDTKAAASRPQHRGASIQERIIQAKQAILKQSVFSCHEISAGLAALDSFVHSVHRASRFGHSLRAFLLYAQCGASGPRSPGFFLERDEVTFAVGLFAYHDRLAMHLVAPQGARHPQYTAALSRWLIENDYIDIAYVRQISTSDAKTYETFGFENLNADTAWNAHAPFEDETFNHRIIDLEACVQTNSGSVLSVKNLVDGGTKNFRNKFRLSYQRCKNFLDRNDLSFSFRQLKVEDIVPVRRLIEDHFAILNNTRKAVGSCALDYELLLTHPLPDDARYISLVGVLHRQGRELITSIFLGERTSAISGGLYCSITNRDSASIQRVMRNLDPTGFTALPQYALATFFGELLARGWRTLDLGGSETADLDRFKRQMGAKELITTWRVMK